MADPELGPRVGWMITRDSNAWSKMNKGNDSNDEDNTQGSNSDWSANAAKEMCDLVKDMPCPLGGVVGDIVDKTPKEQITKVVLEDKVSHTLVSCLVNSRSFSRCSVPLINRQLFCFSSITTGTTEGPSFLEMVGFFSCKEVHLFSHTLSDHQPY